MHTILVPTDFSSAADNALNYAIEIASKLGSKILLYHVFTMRKRADYDWNYPAEEQPFVKRLEQKMEATRSKFAEKVEEKGLSLQTRVEEHSTISLFQSIANNNRISLIIMGSKGAGGVQQAIFGSVAELALEVSKVPVLLVPPEYSFEALEQIVFSTDLNEVSEAALSPIQQLAGGFEAKLTILNVSTSRSQSTYEKSDLLFKGVDHDYREVPMSKSINESINEFINTGKYDLLCMVKREVGFIEGFFKKSITSAQAYNSKIPLLVIPDSWTGA